MCGIAGRLQWQDKDTRAVVGRMVEALIHRGPDAHKVQSFGPACLGHCRLSVLDISDAANQPMVDEGGRFAVVFNGEIYNFRELRCELEQHGVAFRTRSDTEVLIEAYKLWGLDCLPRFNGMFAFALWDAESRRLVLARDRLGKKPLFWMPTADGGLVFASEIKALAAEPSLERDVNPAAIGQFLSLGYLLGSQAIWRGVHKLPPAHALVIEQGRPPHLHGYWDLAGAYAQKSSLSPRSAAQALRDLLDDAVRLRLVSDVPVGAFLSGGIDSAAVVSSMCAASGAEAVRTFCAGFDEAGFDERAEAADLARTLGVDHRETAIRGEIGREWPQIAWFADEPFADTSLLPLYALARMARTHVTVCLSGDGGDELFGGYETYVADRLCRATSWLPRPLVRAGLAGVTALPASWAKVGLQFKLKQFLQGHSRDALAAHFSWREIFSRTEKEALLRPEHRQAVMACDPLDDFRRFEAQVATLPLLDRMGYVDINTWLVDDILVKLDRASMAHGLEARAPFLDYRLVEFAASLPPEMKLRGLNKKWILKKSLSGRVPGRVLSRRKQGFNAPLAHWLDPRRGLLADLPVAELAGQWFRPEAVQRLIDEHMARRSDNSFKLMTLMSLALWTRSQTRHEAAA